MTTTDAPLSVAEAAARLGTDPDRLAARLSGDRVERTPRRHTQPVDRLAGDIAVERSYFPWCAARDLQPTPLSERTPAENAAMRERWTAYLASRAPRR